MKKLLSLCLALVILAMSVPSFALGNIVPEGRRPLANTIYRLENNMSLTVGYLGGSLTAGTGASNSNQTSWRAKTTKWFNETYPNSNITEINAAIGGFGSIPDVFRMKTDLLSGSPDLVFVDTAVNDYGGNETEVKKSVEGIVRQIYKANPKADIVFVYTAHTAGMTECYANDINMPTVDWNESIAEYYGIPSVNMGLNLYNAISNGETTYDEVYPTSDKTHPCDIGYQYFTDALVSFLETALDFSNNNTGTQTNYSMPVKLNSACYDKADILDSWDTKDVISNGFDQINTTMGGRYPHMIGTNGAGATIDVSFRGTAVGLYWLKSPDGGNIEYWVDNGTKSTTSACDSTAISSGSARGTYTMLYTNLADTEHVLHIRTTGTKITGSTGTWVKFGGFFVSARVDDVELEHLANINITANGTEVTIKGKATTENEIISAVIMPKNNDISLLSGEGSLNEEVTYASTIVTDGTGNFSLTADLGQVSDNFVLMLKGANHELYTQEFYFDGLAENETKIYVATNGNDSTGDGSIDKPFATLSKANSVALSALQNADSDVQIIVRQGTYHFSSSLSYSADYSGRNSNRFIIKAYDGEDVNFKFSRQVTGWTLHENGIYVANINANENPSYIYETNKMAFKARTPNRDTLNNMNTYKKVDKYSTDNPKTSFYYAQGDIPQIADITGLQLYAWPGGSRGVYNWSTNIRTISSIDRTNQLVTISSATQYELGVGSRYFIQGAYELLDQSGEFYTDVANRKLYYKPYSVSNLESGVEIPSTNGGIYIYGTEAAPVKNIVIQGINISNTDNSKAGIKLNNAENVEIKNCKIDNIGYRGISVEGASKYNNIHNNLITNVTGNGITISGIANMNYESSFGNIVENNLINGVGYMDGNSACIMVMHSAENIIRYNKVLNAPRYGVQIRGNPRTNLIGNEYNGVLVTEDNFRNFQSVRGNIIEFNEVSKVNNDCQDSGAIGSWGTNLGNVIRNNYIHDVANNLVNLNPTHSFGFIIYNDEDSDGFVIENNIITRSSANNGAVNRGLVFPRGTGEIIRNNYFINNPNVSSVFYYNNTYETSGEAYGSFDISFKNNVIVNSGQYIYMFADEYYNGKNGLYSMAEVDNNLIDKTESQCSISSVTPVISSFALWKQTYGKDVHSVHKNALIMDAGNDDYRLAPNSPVITDGLGISEINQRDMGLTKDFSFATAVGSVERIFARKSSDVIDKSYGNFTEGVATSFEITYRDSNGFLHDAQNVAVTSSNDQVATYNNGKIYAMGEGEATLTISVTAGGETKSILYYANVTSSSSLRLEKANGSLVQSASELISGEEVVGVADYANSETMIILAMYRDNSLVETAISTGGNKTNSLIVPENKVGVRYKVMLWKNLMPVANYEEIK